MKVRENAQTHSFADYRSQAPQASSAARVVGFKALVGIDVQHALFSFFSPFTSQVGMRVLSEKIKSLTVWNPQLRRERHDVCSPPSLYQTRF